VNQSELEKLLKISENAYEKSSLEPYDTFVIIYYGDLDCDNPLEEKTANKALFERGIEFGYYTRKKCLFKKEKYLAADIYYLDDQNKFLGYFDGRSVFPSLSGGKETYKGTENFVQFLLRSELSNIFSLGCALDMSKYYAVNSQGHAVLIDEFLFRDGLDPVKKIPELD
jgi:hypothetical protein